MLFNITIICEMPSEMDVPDIPRSDSDPKPGTRSKHSLTVKVEKVQEIGEEERKDLIEMMVEGVCVYVCMCVCV